MRSVFLACVLLGCSRTAPHAVADPSADARVPVVEPESSVTTLPLVSGCGCAYQCAHGIRRGPEGVWDVTHDFLDSATIKAVIQRWCFDDKGHAYPEASAPKEASFCRLVFYDRTPCGGECIPTTKFTHCGEK
ncbi:MAG: hypothetical protein ACXVEE_28150 [Polyangiales bacterium]